MDNSFRFYENYDAIRNFVISDTELTREGEILTLFKFFFGRYLLYKLTFKRFFSCSTFYLVRTKEEEKNKNHQQQRRTQQIYSSCSALL